MSRARGRHGGGPAAAARARSCPRSATTTARTASSSTSRPANRRRWRRRVVPQPRSTPSRPTPSRVRGPPRGLRGEARARPGRRHKDPNHRDPRRLPQAGWSEAPLLRRHRPGEGPAESELPNADYQPVVRGIAEPEWRRRAGGEERRPRAGEGDAGTVGALFLGSTARDGPSAAQYRPFYHASRRRHCPRSPLTSTGYRVRGSTTRLPCCATMSRSSTLIQASPDST